MGLWLALWLGLASGLMAQPLECTAHPIYCKIVELKPQANKLWAMEFSEILTQQSKKHKTDPWRSLAIAMQESSLENIHRTERVIVFKEICRSGMCYDDYDVVDGYSDLGLFQLSVDTVLNNNIDPIKLKDNISYAVDWHIKILKQKEKECASLGDEAWSCYHTKTPSLRKRYVKMVNRYYFAPTR